MIVVQSSVTREQVGIEAIEIDLVTSRFPLGRLWITPGARMLPRGKVEACVRRHAAGDWGEVTEHDARANDADLLHGAATDFVHSAGVYLVDGQKLWVFTSGHRASPDTTIMLPVEY